MQIVIDIPKEQYETLNAKSQSEVKTILNTPQLIRAIKNGTPLPEHHGRLIDADKLLREHHIDLSDVAPTVIPATERSNNADID